jgi:hypothetical protein
VPQQGFAFSFTETSTSRSPQKCFDIDIPVVAIAKNVINNICKIFCFIIIQNKNNRKFVPGQNKN